MDIIRWIIVSTSSQDLLKILPRRLKRGFANFAIQSAAMFIIDLGEFQKSVSISFTSYITHSITQFSNGSVRSPLSPIHGSPSIWSAKMNHKRRIAVQNPILNGWSPRPVKFYENLWLPPELGAFERFFKCCPAHDFLFG